MGKKMRGGGINTDLLRISEKNRLKQVSKENNELPGRQRDTDTMSKISAPTLKKSE